MERYEQQAELAGRARGHVRHGKVFARPMGSRSTHIKTGVGVTRPHDEFRRRRGSGRVHGTARDAKEMAPFHVLFADVS